MSIGVVASGRVCACSLRSRLVFMYTLTWVLNARNVNIFHCKQFFYHTVFVLGRQEGYTVKYTPLPKGIPEGEARGNS